jgi:hypothetical protein
MPYPAEERKDLFLEKRNIEKTNENQLIIRRATPAPRLRGEGSGEGLRQPLIVSAAPHRADFVGHLRPASQGEGPLTPSKAR